MSFTIRHCWLFAVLVLATLPGVAGSAPIPRVTQEQVQQWIRQLGDRSFATRQQAEERLWKAGKTAEAALQKAVSSPDREVRERATRILDKFKWGIYPRTPKHLLELINQYRQGATSVKFKVTRQLLEEGSQGVETVLKIAQAEDERFRQQLYQAIVRDMGRALPALLAERRLSSVETLLALGLERDHAGTLPHYVAYYALRGRTKEQVEHFEKRMEAGLATVHDQETLLYLYRANGDAKSAIALADKMNRHDLLVPLLNEQRDWKTLSERNLENPKKHPVEKLAFRMAYHRLAGNEKAAEEMLNALRNHAAQVADKRSAEIWYVAKALFINGEPDEALKVITSGTRLTHKFEILCVLQRYEEAFALVEEQVKQRAPEAGELQVRQGYYLYQFGDTDKALKTFDEVAKLTDANGRFPWMQKLIEAEKGLALTKRAEQHCLQMLAGKTASADIAHWLRPLLGSSQSLSASIWWEAFRQAHNTDTPAQTLQRVKDVAAGNLKGDDLKKFLQSAQTQLNVPQRNPSQRMQWYRALAEAALLGGDFNAAKQALESAANETDSTQDLITFGDELVKREQWKEAAAVYRRAWDKSRNQPLGLFLHGWTLTKTGSAKDGKEAMEQSHWVLMGNEYSRIDFARELAKRGHTDDAAREYELVARCGRLDLYQVSEGLRQRGLRAKKKNDYVEATAAYEAAMLRVMRTYVSFLQDRAYVTVPARVHAMRARDFVINDRPDDAKKEIQRYKKILPKSIDLATTLVPHLEKKDRKKEADDLFAETLKMQEAECKKHPNSARALNTYAWLCAVCKRNLAEGQRRAEKSVALLPDHSGHRDTLAEILFQRGEKDKAIAEMKKCIELNPNRPYYRLQLKRMEAGDKNAPLPPE